MVIDEKGREIVYKDSEKITKGEKLRNWHRGERYDKVRDQLNLVERYDKVRDQLNLVERYDKVRDQLKFWAHK